MSESNSEPRAIAQRIADLKLLCVEKVRGPAADGIEFPRLGHYVEQAVSRATDEYVRLLARGEDEPPTPEVAAGLFPRLVMAGGLRETVAPPAAEAQSSPLEWLLVTMWHRQWKARWLAGDVRPVDDRSYEGDLPPGHRPR